ncbi:MAG TPA: type II secretion system protein, partial [Thermoanaerobaculia bacterium]|nr:type II secretion system protein [Thermoanaerobaculia bacterium]
MARQRGFTLAEVLVALLVLTIVITTTLAVFVERQRRMRIANHIIVAHQVLTNEMEIRRRINFDQLESAATTFLADTEILRPL